MKPITLSKPIVLCNTLADMPMPQKQTAFGLLVNKIILVPGENGLQFVPVSKEKHANLPKYYLYGSEAVCYYRQSLGLTDKSISFINADNIITSIDDTDTLYDVLFICDRIRIRNERYIRFRELGAPDILLWSAYRLLQEAVESLYDLMDTEASDRS